MDFFETKVRTGFGPVRIIWAEARTGPVVMRITLPGDRRSGTGGSIRTLSAVSGDDMQIRVLAAGVRSFLSGYDIAFDIGILGLDRCSPFQRSVLIAEYGIPRGYVSTYGRIAARIGHATGARAVGNALATNPFPIVIPCHRALRSDGSLGGFQGGPELKAELLRMEGIRFRKDGRAIQEQVWY